MNVLRNAPRLALALVAVGAMVGRAPGQSGYGVDASMRLHAFDLATPGVASSIGFLPFLPEGIDFRPSTDWLYAIDVGPNTTQLYRVSTSTAAVTPVGVGFASAGSVGGVSYDLTTARSFGFDFNPKTVQGDGSIRIRLTADNGANLRLNDTTGAIAAVDGPLTYAASDPNFGAPPTIGGSAYINNFAELASAGGVTTLYDIDHGANRLVTQIPPNSGTLNTVGPLNVDPSELLGFDILTNLGVAPTNVGYAALSSGGIYRLHTIDLATGVAGPGVVSQYGFEGGLAVVPEPATLALGILGSLGVLALALRKRAS